MGVALAAGETTGYIPIIKASVDKRWRTRLQPQGSLVLLYLVI